MPAVSIVIPTYRHRDFVRETLASVFAQTFTDYEVIVINDGSPDDTAGVLRDWIEKDKIRYVEQANAGQAEARNRGIAMAEGEFVALLDDDDLWPPDKLQWQVEMLRSSDATAVSGLVRTLKNGQLDTIAESDRVDTLTTRGLFLSSPIYSPGQTLVRASSLRAVGGFDPAIWGCDDLDLWMRLAHLGPLRVRHRVALHYRVHPGNASHAWERMLLNKRKVVAKNLKLLPVDQQSAAARDGERSTYVYAASPRVQAVWSVRPRRWTQAARAVSYFARSAVTDPKLAASIAKDFVPLKLRRMIRPVPRGA